MSLCAESKNNFRTPLTVHSVVCCVTRCGLVSGNKHFIVTFLMLETVRSSEMPVTACLLQSGRHESHHRKIQGLVYSAFEVNSQNHLNNRNDIKLIRLLDRRGRYQWPRGLRRRSAASRLLRLWVRIPPGACVM